MGIPAPREKFFCSLFFTSFALNFSTDETKMSEESGDDEWFDPRQLEVIGPDDEEDSHDIIFASTTQSSSWNNGHNPSISNSKSQSTEVKYEALEMVVEDVPMNGLIIEDFQLVVDHLPDVHNDMDPSTITTTSNLAEYEWPVSVGLCLLVAFCVIRLFCCGWFRNNKREHDRPSSRGRKGSSSTSVVVQINDILSEAKESLWYTNTYVSSHQIISVVNDLHDCAHSLRDKVRDDCRIRDDDQDSSHHTNPYYSNKHYHDGPNDSMLAEYKGMARRIDDMMTDIADVIEPLVLQEGFPDGIGHGHNPRHRLGGRCNSNSTLGVIFTVHPLVSSNYNIATILLRYYHSPNS